MKKQQVALKTRRDLLKMIGATGIACIFGDAAQANAPRVIVLDWGAAETMLAMGIHPIGLAELGAYNKVVDSAQYANDDIIDVGLRLAPNAEAMHTLAPSLIIINSAQEYMRSSLESFAPVHVFEIYGTANDPYVMAEQATAKLGDALGAGAAATALQTETRSKLLGIRNTLSVRSQHPTFVIQLQDQRHAAVFGKGSMVQAVLDKIGLVNAWQGGADFWGLSVVGLEALASEPTAQIAYFALPQVDVAAIQANVFWQNLPSVRAGLAVNLPPLWAYGGLPSAARMAKLLSYALLESRQ